MPQLRLGATSYNLNEAKTPLTECMSRDCDVLLMITRRGGGDGKLTHTHYVCVHTHTKILNPGLIS